MAEIDKISEIIEETSTYYSKIKNKKGKIRRDTVAAEEHKLVYDSSSETLEPVYFWILDMMNGLFSGKVEKLIDNFTSSPGSGHFSELMGKATRMQEEGMKIMQTIGVLIKSLINIIYDLRQFEIRFNDYNAVHSKNKAKAEAGEIALKQIWLDNVDIKRGNTSIKAMTFSQAAFATLIDAFMIASSEEQVKKMDLNERVKRILEQRIFEYKKWKDLSEKELRKRYEIERAWLKSQVNSLQLYTRWAKPYLKAAEELSMSTSKNAALVKAFNTINIELTLLGKKKINLDEEAVERNIPENFKNLKLKRDYYNCVLIDFSFRGIPQKAGQHYVFGGRAEVTFRGYCLNEDELAMIEEKLNESDLSDALRLVEGATEESLNQIKEDIEYFLKDESERKLETHEKSEEQDINPFSALFGFGKRKPKTEKGKTKEDKEKNKKKAKIEKLREKGVPSDSYVEGVVRAFGEKFTAEKCFDIFDIYKKAHNMPSHPNPFD